VDSPGASMLTRSPILTRVSVVGATVLAAVALTACGNGNVGQDIPHSGQDWNEVTVPYMGGVLHCITLKIGDGQGTWGGPTCDFVRFYKEAGK
jgi:predicted small secreted protein